MKITYLIGAGASSGTLPLAADLGEKMNASIEGIKKDLEKFYAANNRVYPDALRPPPRGIYGKEFFEAMTWLASTAANHNTVDTIARKYWMRSDSRSIDELNRLKATLAAYFWYRQISQPSDRRYDSFLATILQKPIDHPPTLPDSVSIITWNYDSLIERSFYEFCLDYDHTRSLLVDNPGVIHLNGSATFSLRNEGSEDPRDSLKFEIALFKDTTDRFKMLFELFNRCISKPSDGQLRTNIAFAWEHTAAVEQAIEAAFGTNILVVAGYSFPFFNRDIDKRLVDSAIDSLETIYLQAAGDVGARERLFSILKQAAPNDDWRNRVHEIQDTNLIHIPFELIQ